MSICGLDSIRSTPSNFVPFTLADEVSSSIVSRPMKGSASPPLPTSPGQSALCTNGLECCELLIDILYTLCMKTRLCDLARPHLSGGNAVRRSALRDCRDRNASALQEALSRWCSV